MKSANELMFELVFEIEKYGLHATESPVHAGLACVIGCIILAIPNILIPKVHE